MINIEKFIQIRKSKKISQTELAKGICTQATLSHFENNGQVPTYKILQQLCARLQIQIGDIMFSTDNNPISNALREAESAFINFDYYRAQQALSRVQPQKIAYQAERLHFIYLQGLYALWAERDPMRAAYFFNTIVQTPQIEEQNIFRLLALLGLGLAYEQAKNVKRAGQNYDLLVKNLPQLHLSVNDEVTAFRLISLYYHPGNFYSKNRHFKRANSLLRKAYQIGRQKHVIFYMERILYRLGANDIKNGDIKAHTRQRLQDACAFARFNQSQVTLNRARKLLAKLS